MPAPVFGYSMSRFADQRARAAEREDVEPLPPGVDPLDALDPELRALVVSTGPVGDARADGEPVDLVDRLRAGAVGALLGTTLGVIAINVGTTTRRQVRTATAPPMDRTHTLVAAGVGAAIGAVSGLARGYSPLERAPVERPMPIVPAPAVVTDPGAPHPAFASLHAPAGA